MISSSSKARLSQQSISQFFQPVRPKSRLVEPDLQLDCPSESERDVTHDLDSEIAPVVEQPLISAQLKFGKLKRFVNQEPKSLPNPEPSSKRLKIGQRSQRHQKITLLDLKHTEDEHIELENESGAESDEKVDSAKQKPKRGKKGNNGKPLSEFNEQIIQLKLQHPGIILAVHVGYKYQFFGEDSFTVSRELHICNIPGWRTIEHALSPDSLYDKFSRCIVPDSRIMVHVERLIDKGYKVGLVEQTETAALKAAGSTKSKVFSRKLTRVITRATYIDKDLHAEGMVGSTGLSEYIFCVCEQPLSPQRVTIGFVALAVSTGRLIYEEFHDGFMRSELEGRVLYLEPSEIVIVGEISPESEKILQNLISSAPVDSSRIRIDRVEKPDFDEARSRLTEYYANLMTNSNDDDDVGNYSKLLDQVLQFPLIISQCLCAAMTYLKQYDLDGVFQLTDGFDDFKSQTTMKLNANTLASLEIFRNQSDNAVKGSLFWVLDYTKTRFGQRMLYDWVGHPLLDRQQLESRIEAIEEIRSAITSPELENLSNLMTQLPDLETGLMKIHYGRAKPSELGSTLSSFDRICNIFSNCQGGIPKAISPLLKSYYEALPVMSFEISEFLDTINQEAAVKNDKLALFNDESQYTDIVKHKNALARIEQEFSDLLIKIRKDTNRSYIKYSKTKDEDHLIEIRKSETRTVPKDWVVINSTKTVRRYRPAAVTALISERDREQELLVIESNRAYDSFLHRIAQHLSELRVIVFALANIDCLMSLALVSNKAGYVRPELVDEPCIEVIDGRHPVIELLLLDSFVPNDVDLSSQGTQTMIITGPNMGGKSCFVRQTALMAILAQIGSYVPAQFARIGLVDGVFTRMGASDNMLTGESTFMVELHECADIMRQATRRSLVVLDEIGRGTGPIDGAAIAFAVLAHFIEEIGSLTLFITHYPLLCAFADRFEEDRVQNYFMQFLQHKDSATGEVDITFLYKIARGIADRAFGINVARLADLPSSILSCAQEVSNKIRAKEQLTWAILTRNLIQNHNLDRNIDETVDDLLNLSAQANIVLN
ncbi:muts domain V-domain-containing protein [Lipomyces oligophaga]|uniref:muts domain V-domain-containing protein n=1 Tax=Lipomyces oligophaga TaxID=45792 RepID=UPI0034CE9CC9